MASKVEMRQWRDAVEDTLNRRDAAERYGRRQREISRGRGRGDDGPGPLEFDDGGFPIPQPRRVASTGPATWAYWTAITATVVLLVYMGWVA